MFFPSPRNNLEAQLSLLRETAATGLIVPDEEPPVVAQILKSHPIRKLVIPSLSVIIDDRLVRKIAYTKTFDAARMDPFLILHTSGSTGIPKAITIRHGYTTTMDAYSRFAGGSEVARRIGKKKAFNPFPPSHMAGIMWSLPIVCWIESTIVLPPPVPISSSVVDACLKYGNVVYATIAPSIVVELANNEDTLERLKNLEGLGFAGGPLPKATGDKLREFTTVHSSYGSTEMMAPPVLPKEPEDWQYLRFDFEQSGIELRQTDDDTNVFELVIVRRPELNLTQAIFVTFPELDEYRTKDLFTPHPEKPDLWLYASRRDDILVLSNGEKFNPTTMEGSIVSGCSHVKGCIVIGRGQFQTALLVECNKPPENDHEREKMTDIVWPVVQQANQASVAHGRIARGFILFTKADMPLPRAGKGTIQRAKAVELYQDEIDLFYADRQTVPNERVIGLQLDLTNVQATELALKEYIGQEFDITPEDLDDDLFRWGFDSLQAMSMVRMVNSILPPGCDQIGTKHIYENPTIRKLAASLCFNTISLRQEDDDDLDAWVQMQQTWHDLTTNLRPVQQNEKASTRHDRHKPSWFAFSDITRSDQTGNPDLQRLRSDYTRDGYDALRDEDFLISMIPPDGGRIAWMQILASFLINFNTFGLVCSFGDYQAYYQSDLLRSKSDADIAWIGTAQAALLLIVGVFSGPIFDKGYFMITLQASTIALVFAYMMLSLADQYYQVILMLTFWFKVLTQLQVMLSQGILAGVCVGLLYIPSVALLPLYFRDRRGLALGCALSGAPFGAIIYSVVFQAVLPSIGFGWATRIIGFIALATLGTAILIIRPPIQAQDNGRRFLDIGALQEIPFLAFMLTAFLVYCAWLIPYFLTPAFAQHLGTSADTATYLVAVLNAGQIFGRIVPAVLSDYWGGEKLLLLAQVVGGVLGLSWLTITSLGGFIEFQIFYGFTSGMLATLPAVVVPYLCPTMAVLGTRMGMIYASAGVGVLLGSPVAFVAADVPRGNFKGAQVWMGLCLLVGSGFFVVSARAAQKQRESADLGLGGRAKRKVSLERDVRWILRMK